MSAQVIVKVDEVGDRPGSLFPIKVKVYRGETLSGTEPVRKGSAELGYTDVTPWKPGTHPWVLHEFGHMLGFDDEYQWANGNPASVMFRAQTGDVLVEHGQLFADTLKAISGVGDWQISMR